MYALESNRTPLFLTGWPLVLRRRPLAVLPNTSEGRSYITRFILQKYTFNEIILVYGVLTEAKIKLIRGNPRYSGVLFLAPGLGTITFIGE